MNQNRWICHEKGTLLHEEATATRPRSAAQMASWDLLHVPRNKRLPRDMDSALGGVLSGTAANVAEEGRTETSKG